MGKRKRLAALEARVTELERTADRRRKVSHELPPAIEVELPTPAALPVAMAESPGVPLDSGDDMWAVYL